jgi:hypothetical protein
MIKSAITERIPGRLARRTVSLIIRRKTLQRGLRSPRATTEERPGKFVSSVIPSELDHGELLQRICRRYHGRRGIAVRICKRARHPVAASGRYVSVS